MGKNNKLFACIIITFTYCSLVSAKGYTPNDDDVLLVSDSTDIVKRYRSILQKQPDNIDLLYTLTKKLLHKAKKEESINLYGKIESILQQNKKNVMSNSDLKLIYAEILQQRHAFLDAIKILNGIDKLDANLMKAAIYQNIGEYKKATIECNKIKKEIKNIVASTCLLHAKSYQGHLKQSYMDLKSIIDKVSIKNIEHRVWVISALGEMASRLGRNIESERFFYEAYRLNPSRHILTEWIDSLEKLNKHDVINDLLEKNTNDIKLALRYLRAFKIVNNSKNNMVEQQLNKEIALINLRKDDRDYDSRAEYYLWVNQDSDKALYWAKKNWSKYKTPAAAKLLISASKLANSNETISEVIKWKNNKNIQDVSLEKIIFIDNYKSMSIHNKKEIMPSAVHLNKNNYLEGVMI